MMIKKKARGFMCGGCGGSKAVSVSDGSSSGKQSPAATPRTAVSSAPTTTVSSAPTTTVSSFTTTATTTMTTKAARRAGNGVAAAAAVDAPSSFSSSPWYADTTDDGKSSSVESTPSLSALLRQLRELERSVRFLQAAAPGASGGAVYAGADAAAAASKNNNSNSNNGVGGRRHRRTVSEGGSGRVEESVAVVKESADPLADFRRSMLQMIVEKEIMGGPELRELLHRFLSLNSPHHHHLILRAFAEIWEEVFAGYDRTPDFLAADRDDKNKRQNVRA